MPTTPPFSDEDAFSDDSADEDSLYREDIDDEQIENDDESSEAGSDREIERAERLSSRMRLIELLATARARSDEGDIYSQSNLDFVRDQIEPGDEAYLEELYWTLRPQQHRLVDAPSREEDSPTALIVDNDPNIARDYGLALSSNGFRVMYAFSVDDALRVLYNFRDIFKFVVVDVRMPTGDYFGSFETAGGMRTGLAFAAEIASFAPSAILVALSNSNDPTDVSWFEAQEDAIYCRKSEFPPDRFVSVIRRDVMKEISSLRIFIIHGHDKLAALDLKNYLQNNLGFPEPVILSERKSKGMTVIEKLEHYISDADLVFALFTPDDFVAQPKEAKRARQNVVLEFGIVLGMLGRKSGRIFYLYKQGVEIPSDLAGIIYIDISNGVAAAGEEIRTELEDYLQR